MKPNEPVSFYQRLHETIAARSIGPEERVHLLHAFEDPNHPIESLAVGCCALQATFGAVTFTELLTVGATPQFHGFANGEEFLVAVKHFRLAGLIKTVDLEAKTLQFDWPSEAFACLTDKMDEPERAGYAHLIRQLTAEVCTNKASAFALSGGLAGLSSVLSTSPLPA